MTNSPASETDGRGAYEIRVQGRLEPRWAAWFDGMSLTAHDDGTTSIHGDVVDPSALHGLLAKLRDIGLPLLSVTHTGNDRPDSATSQTQ